MSTWAERTYDAYMGFFEKAERTRRWSVFNDVPWDKIADSPKNERLALCAETFSGVEMYLPDYTAQHIQVMRASSFGQAWFAANWAYEESKHALVLREYLVRSGQRSWDEVRAFEQRIFARHWQQPFDTDRKMTMYGAIQEMATFVIYAKQRKIAKAEGDDVLSEIYRLIARDEVAHANFYVGMVGLYLEDDREGTLDDLAFVFRNFKMPAEELVPDYDARIEVMRSAGIDRGVFIKEIMSPILRDLQLTRHDLPLRQKQEAQRDTTGLGPTSVA